MLQLIGALVRHAALSRIDQRDFVALLQVLQGRARLQGHGCALDADGRRRMQHGRAIDRCRGQHEIEVPAVGLQGWAAIRCVRPRHRDVASEGKRAIAVDRQRVPRAEDQISQ
ncbi:hypothetical protein D3C72_1694190 [compost metagenome]